MAIVAKVINLLKGAIKTLPMFFQNYGQRPKKSRATFFKITGNVFENDGQCFLKLRATFFRRIGRV